MRLIDIHSIQVSTLKNVLTVASGKPKTVTKIAKETDMTYAHLHKVILLLDKLGYITTQKSGRNRICSLTEKGNALIIQLQRLNLSAFKCSIHICTLVKILGAMDIKPKIGRTILRETGIVENIVYDVIKGFENAGLITTFKSGRTKSCTITEQGKALYTEMKAI